jgi:hypothetical protein
MQVHYLEIVTLKVDATCATHEQLHGVRFGESHPGLGNARTDQTADKSFNSDSSDAGAG